MLDRLAAHRSTPPRVRVVMLVLVAATVSTVFPGFLIGALAVQVQDDLGVSTATYGWGLGSFFLAATAGSAILGRLAQRIGARRQITASLCVSVAAQVAIASAARSFAAVVALLVVAGLVNAANQTAINLVLSQAALPRLGLAMAIKQSSMPSAALLAGVAVPAFALTVGWRWAYVGGALLASGAAVAVLAVIAPQQATVRRRVARPVTSSRVLVAAAVAAAGLSFGAGALNAWVVSSGVDAGLDPGVAGLMLSVGAASGITMRLVAGARIDRSRVRPFAAAAGSAALGAVGMAALGVGTPVVHIAATIVAFGAGWIWPVFTNYGVVRSNPDAAASATGITQTGVYVGVFAAPLVTGAVIETYGYSTAWIVVAAVTLVGVALARSVADHF